MTIRVACPSDAIGILRVHQEAILARAADHYALSTLQAWALGATPDRIARLEKQIADPGFIVLIAETGDEVIGYGMAVPSRQQLRALYVKPNEIGRVGHSLLGELEKLAFRTSKVLICDASLNAVPFYKAHGYTEEGGADHVLSSGVSIRCKRMRKVCSAESAS